MHIWRYYLLFAPYPILSATKSPRVHNTTIKAKSNYAHHIIQTNMLLWYNRNIGLSLFLTFPRELVVFYNSYTPTITPRISSLVSKFVQEQSADIIRVILNYLDDSDLIKLFVYYHSESHPMWRHVREALRKRQIIVKRTENTLSWVPSQILLQELETISPPYERHSITTLPSKSSLKNILACFCAMREASGASFNYMQKHAAGQWMLLSFGELLGLERHRGATKRLARKTKSFIPIPGGIGLMDMTANPRLYLMISAELAFHSHTCSSYLTGIQCECLSKGLLFNGDPDEYGLPRTSTQGSGTPMHTLNTSELYGEDSQRWYTCWGTSEEPWE